MRHCPNLKAAQRELDRILARVNARHAAGTFRTPTRFSSLLDIYFPRYVENQGLKPSTRSGYDSMAETWIRPFFGDWQLEEITPGLVTEFFAHLARRGLSDKYRRNLYALLKLLFDVAVENDLLETTPLRPRVHRPRTERREKVSLTVEQARRILDEVREPWRAPIWTLALTGLRSGELLALRWQDVDFVAGHVRIRHSLWRRQLDRPKTAQSVRTLFLSQPLERLLLEYRQRARFTAPDDFVFPRPDGQPLHADTLRRSGLYPAFDRAGIERIPRDHALHAFRHLAGSIIHDETGSLKLAQTQLGHANVSTTADVYTHLSSDALEKTASILGEVLGNPCCNFVVETPKCTEIVH